MKTELLGMGDVACAAAILRTGGVFTIISNISPEGE